MTSRLPDVTSDVNLPHVPPGVSTAAMRRPGSGGRLPPPSALIHVRRTPTAADKPTAPRRTQPHRPQLAARPAGLAAEASLLRVAGTAGSGGQDSVANGDGGSVTQAARQVAAPGGNQARAGTGHGGSAYESHRG